MKSIVGMTAVFSSMLFVVTSCGVSGLGQGGKDTSALQQLHSGYVQCTFHPERIAGLKQRYGKSVTLVGGDHGDSAWQHMSAVPEAYLHWMFVDQGMPLLLVPDNYNGTPWGVRGLTTVMAGSDAQGNATYHIKGMWVKAPVPMGTNVVFNGLIHEMGHAIDHYNLMRPEVGTKYDQEMEALYDWSVVQGNDKANLSMMAVQRVQEYAAEWFDSYYCSDATRKLMQNNHPKAWDMAQRYLLPWNKMESADVPVQPGN